MSLFDDSDMFFDPSSITGMLSSIKPGTMGLAGLQGLSSVAGIMSQMNQTRAAGQQTQASDYLKAATDELNANQSYVAGVGQVTGLRQQLMNSLGSRAAAAGGSGIDGGQGVVQDNARAISQNNLEATGTATNNAAIASTRQRIDALTSMFQGNQAEMNAQGMAKAQLGTGILGGLLSIGKLFL